MKQFISLALIFFAISTAVFAQTDLQPAAIVRLTKSEAITVKQFRTEVDNFQKSSGQVLSREQQRQLLDSMIDRKLIMQAADRDRLLVTENEVNQQIQQYRTSLSQQLGKQATEAEFATAIRQQTGMEIPAFKEQIRQQMVLQKYILTKKDALIKTLKEPSETDIVNFYNMNKAQFIRPDTVRFSMIQIRFVDQAGRVDTSAKTKAKDLGDRLIREIGSNPSKFDEAVTKGQAPSAGYQAGDGVYLERTAQSQQRVGTDFINIAFGLKQSEVSRLIESPTAYHIIKVTGTYEQKFLILDDILQLGTSVTVRQYIANGLYQQRQQELLDQATKEVSTELRKGNPFQIYENNLTW
jgi:parvulin-like peptidyl-prolyl isomerase